MSIDAIHALQQGLQKALHNFEISNQQMGNIPAIIKATEAAKKAFEGYASASAPKERAYAAALKFLREQPLKEDEYDFVTSAIHIPIKEANNIRIIDSENFSRLCKYYYSQITKENMGRLSWYWLFLSYFSIDIDNADSQLSKDNINHLRNFLYKTHTRFTENQDFLPEWAKLLGEHKNILSDTPCDRYAEAYLHGKQDEINKIKESFRISEVSWFWHQLTLSVVRHATNLKQDQTFKKKIPSLIDFLEKHNGYRDEAIKLILERYYKCTDNSANSLLRDYIIRPDIWKNPKLRDTGIASKWHHVNENAWRMVCSWVNRECLRIFFQEIAGLHHADEGRFEFWEKYIDQATYTKIILGEKTNNRSILKKDKCLISRLDSNHKDLDAFVMQIKGYTIVEFSKTGNAAFIYKNDELPFDIDSLKLSDKTYGNGLKAARDEKRKNKKDKIIIHSPPVHLYPNWYDKADAILRDIGIKIYPDIGKKIPGLF